MRFVDSCPVSLAWFDEVASGANSRMVYFCVIGLSDALKDVLEIWYLHPSTPLLNAK